MNHLEIIEDMMDVPIYPALSLIIKGHNTFFDEKLKGTGVSAAELPYIVRIYADNNKLTQRDLCNLFFVSEPVVARTLKNLEKKGFIIRNKDPKNRTRKLLSLTDSGIEISKRMFDINDEWEKLLFDNFTSDEIESYKSLTKALAVNSLKL
ncbi:MAG: MarR family transcriptional regulator [Methanobrevibacter sp.]|uniref:MarR family winged helix-turn-helix transcriptional regulator n=1 Tax=Methanobrevibacter sp. TaxID=66852 RepID=UPI0025F9C9DD|nr:MarR family transcriptional regulator [Methanobrevibacter sp.]MBR0270803.1 MarR family transcriptional regulator [Methanobrevibacter sp.]